jgi:phosphatidylinositol 4-kinase
MIASHLDPFYIKEEFAPSNKHVLMKRQQAALNIIGPHLRILQFLNSHFNANRLGSIQIQRIYQRLIQITLNGLRSSSGHPLSREIHFQIVLFGFRVLRFSSGLEAAASSRLHEEIVSAALSWFSHPPRFLFLASNL